MNTARLINTPFKVFTERASSNARLFFRTRSQQELELLRTYDPLTVLGYDKKIARKYPDILDAPKHNYYTEIIVKKLVQRNFSLAWRGSAGKQEKTIIATDDYVNAYRLIMLLTEFIGAGYEKHVSIMPRVDAFGLVFGFRLQGAVRKTRFYWVELTFSNRLDEAVLSLFSGKDATDTITVYSHQHSMGTLVEHLEKLLKKQKPLHEVEAEPKSIKDYIARYTATRAGVRNRLHTNWG